MSDAVARFASYQTSADAWALGRFVVPASRLEEFASAVDGVRETPREPTRSPTWPWALTVLASLPLDADLERISAFRSAHDGSNGQWTARVDSLEVKASSGDEIDGASARVPAEIEVFFEVPAKEGVDDLCEAAAKAGRGLKLRTGGTTVDAFPPSASIARFLSACAFARVPFKATAGLHHPIRSAHPVSYEPGAPSATMHGFLNVFVAAALLLNEKVDVPGATRVLEDELEAGFAFSDDWLAWREFRLDVSQIMAARHFARSFGSCSFEEPLGELPKEWLKA
jgi:hypothetical protein